MLLAAHIMQTSVPLSSPDITQAEIDAVVEVLRSPTLSIGPRIEQFEQLCARIAGRRHGVGVSSGTAGLHLCMLAAGIRPGDEVITTPFSFVASTNCILYVGAKPVFVDIDPRTLNIDVGRVEAAITPRTRAIVGVEVFGHPAGMPELERIARKHELVLIEDCCEGFGGGIRTEPPAPAGASPPGGSQTPRPMRKIGSFGRAGVFAFYPNKQITTGEGGMIVTDDDRFAELCRSLRNQGRDGMSWLAHARMGYNYRLSEINAALGIAQINRLEEILNARRRVANEYMRRLMDNRHLILPNIGPEVDMSWFVFVVRLSDQFDATDRDAIIAQLRAEGIGSSNYFPPIHLQPYIREILQTQPGDFPVCEHVSARTIALPFFNRLSESQIDRVCEALAKNVSRLSGSRNRRT
ncbi:MAG: DegT/DnrJ/EryC1/StrS family aminotransferase [Phycisphaerales bacterium]|nr:DegT/DnrJ/EryC1/StrS family aminotransferase [Phycisphaerales bacterium]